MHRHIAGGLSAAAWLWALASPALELGDKAPSLDGVKQWMNGAAVNPAAADGKTVYVVEFWATWCGPCRDTVPHLNVLHEKYAAKGVVVVGVTKEPEATARPFVEQMGMKYRIALDTDDTTGETYMKGVPGIPHAFVVDAKGLVAWAGHPLDGLEEVIESILAGTYDPAKARAMKQDQDALMEAMQAGDFAKSRQIVDRLVANRPKDLEFHQMKLGLLIQAEDVAGLRAQYRRMLETFADDAESLNTLAWMIVAPSPVPLRFRDLETAWQAAQKADRLTGSADPAILDTLALVLYQAGDLAQAIATQEKAVARSEDAEEKRDLQATLDYYREALRVGRMAAGAPAPLLMTPLPDRPPSPANPGDAP